MGRSTESRNTLSVWSRAVAPKPAHDHFVERFALELVPLSDVNAHEGAFTHKSMHSNTLGSETDVTHGRDRW